MERLKRTKIAGPAGGTIFLCLTAVTLGALAGCKQFDRMEENQIKLQAMVAANARQLATLSSQVYATQGKLDDGIQKLDENTEEVAAGVAGVQNGQHQLRELVATGDQQLAATMTQLGGNQQALENGVTQVAEVTQHTAADVTTLAAGQATLHQTVRAGQQEVAGSLGTVVGNQQQIQTGIAHLQQTDEGLAGSVAALAGKQEELHQTVASNTQSLADQIAVVQTDQRNQQAALDRAAGTLDQTAAGITRVAATQATLQEVLAAHRDESAGRLASLADGQQNIRTEIGSLNEKTDRTAAELATASSSLQDALRINRDVLTGQMAASLQNQQSLQAATLDLDAKMSALTTNVRETATGQTAVREMVKTQQDTIIGRLGDLSESQTQLRTRVIALCEKTDAVATAQDSFRQMLENHSGTTNAQMAELTDWRQVLQNQLQTLTASMHQTELNVATVGTQQAQCGDQLDALTATAGQTGLDVLAMAARQDTLRVAVQNQGAAVDGRMARLTDGQRQIQDGLDTVTATTGQAALDVLTLGNGQTRLEQATQTGRDELITRLTEIAQDQQNWLQRLDAAQAKVNALADGITALEQRLATLQGTLQTSIQDLTASVNMEGARRLQLETKVSQDLQAVIDTVSALRQTQTSLREKMAQAKENTPPQTESIPSATEQTEPPQSEVTVSDAAAKAAPPVPEAAK